MDALRAGVSVEAIHELTAYDPWFLHELARLLPVERALDAAGRGERDLDHRLMFAAKRLGLGDQEIARRAGTTEAAVRAKRAELGVTPVFKQVDTCAAEFDAVTSYFYSTYERGENEAVTSDERTIIILGGGPNRIGQGIEFDYCAVHAALALREQGFRAVMINCNPETVSTDYDVSSQLYFEPLTFETVMAVIEQEQPEGVILQFGGQTPLRLAKALYDAGVRVLGSDADAIDRTEDRELFNEIVTKLDLTQPDAATVLTLAEAEEVASDLGYPLLVRPSYVLGGLGMQIVHSLDELRACFGRAAEVSGENPVLIDKFLADAVEVDVDCISDGTDAVIGGVMEHIEEAGVHSGDSACVTPPYLLPESVLRTIREQTLALARELDIVGLMNVQYAVRDHEVYVLEVNPRASRTIPFVSKATGRPLAALAARVMAGERLADLGVTGELTPRHFSVKESVFPFDKFPEVDTILGPQMLSTGEVMGIDTSFEMAFLKAQIAAKNPPPAPGGRVFVSVRDEDKWSLVPVAKKLHELGYLLVATSGTAKLLRAHGLPVEHVNKVKDGQPHVLDAIINGSISLIINTTTGAQSVQDSRSIRRGAVNLGIPYFTTLAAAKAAVAALAKSRTSDPTVRSIQEYHG
jgi:carbamoyl-phosphate synthase large subunit